MRRKGNPAEIYTQALKALHDIELKVLDIANDIERLNDLYPSIGLMGLSVPLTLHYQRLMSHAMSLIKREHAIRMSGH